MSGFEIAGVILGGMPIIISAIEDYRAVQGTIVSLKKSRILLKELLEKLKDTNYHFF